SPFAAPAVLTLDGRGERATTTYGVGNGTRLQQLGEVTMPHSLGLLYEEVTGYLGFLRSADEYKVMALASFGKPAYLDAFREMVRFSDSDGKYQIAMPPLESVFGPRRERGADFEERHYNIARSLQDVLEETTLRMAGWLYDASAGAKDL